jgi:hypothetical protein
MNVLLISVIRFCHLVRHCIDVTFEAVTVKISLLTLFQIMQLLCLNDLTLV